MVVLSTVGQISSLFWRAMVIPSLRWIDLVIIFFKKRNNVKFMRNVCMGCVLQKVFLIAMLAFKSSCHLGVSLSEARSGKRSYLGKEVFDEFRVNVSLECS